MHDVKDKNFSSAVSETSKYQDVQLSALKIHFVNVFMSVRGKWLKLSIMDHHVFLLVSIMRAMNNLNPDPFQPHTQIKRYEIYFRTLCQGSLHSTHPAYGSDMVQLWTYCIGTPSGVAFGSKNAVTIWGSLLKFVEEFVVQPGREVFKPNTKGEGTSVCADYLTGYLHCLVCMNTSAIPGNHPFPN